MAVTHASDAVAPDATIAIRVIIVVVVPFLNEERYLPTLLESLASQSRPPDRLILVDDGSTDNSAAIAGRFTGQHAYARLLHRPRRPRERDRLAYAAELRAFQWGLDHVEEAYDVVAKLDADLGLSPEVLSEVEHQFMSDPRLGVAGPHLAQLDRDGRRVRLRGRPEHVHGPAKFYRRACYEQIVPLAPVLGWDVVDVVKARSLGWRTSSFAVPSGDPLHLRPMGTQDGALRGYRRWGQGDYQAGVHPIIVVVAALRRLRDRPPVLGSLNYLGGWAASAVRRLPKFEPEIIAFAREEQLTRVRGRLPTWFSPGQRPR